MGRRNYFEQPALEQTGLHEGASAVIITFSKGDLDVVCLSNLESGFFNRCAKDVAAIVLGKTIPPIQLRPAVAAPVSALSKLARSDRANDRLGFSLKMIGVNLVFSWVDSTKNSL